MREESKPLTASWAVLRLGDAGVWTGGGTPSKAVPRFWSTEGVPWASPKDMKTARIRDTEDHITREAIEQSAAKSIPAGAVLLVTRSGILEHTLPVAVTDVELTVNQDLKALSPHPGVMPEYVAAALRANASRVLQSCSKDGTTVASIDTTKLLDFEVPLAPTNEQVRIVAEIDSYASRIDESVALLNRVQRNLKRYKTSVLKAAVEGRLVPTEADLARAAGRDYESASVLLKRILVERRRRWEAKGHRGQYEEPEAPDTSKLPDLPNGWCWTTVGAITVDGPQNGLYVPKSQYGTGTHIVRIDDYQVGWSRSRDEFQMVNISAEDAVRYGLGQGDLVINRVNSPSHLGKSLVVADRHIPAVFESNMMRLGLALEVEARFVHHYLSSVDGKKRLTSDAKWAVNQASINQGDVTRTPLPLPPLGEQSRLVIEIERLFSAVEASAVIISSNKTRVARLHQSILRWAFQGKLVDQDPNDEPASFLLADINGEKNAPPSKTVAGPRRSAKKKS
jgi:type I restriction enzyme S subunit